MVEALKFSPAGLSFDLRDLFLAQVWAACRAFRMVIELDYRTDDGDEYEELLVFYRPNSAFRWCMVWRSASEIVVQPSNGPAQRFATLAEALEVMSLARRPQRRPQQARSLGKVGRGRRQEGTREVA
jgi:hypothetical protein